MSLFPPGVKPGGNVQGFQRSPFAFRAYPKTASEKGTVPFCSEDSAKLGQSPAVFGWALKSSAAVRPPKKSNNSLPASSCHRRYRRRAKAGGQVPALAESLLSPAAIRTTRDPAAPD